MYNKLAEKDGYIFVDDSNINDYNIDWINELDFKFQLDEYQKFLAEN